MLIDDTVYYIRMQWLEYLMVLDLSTKDHQFAHFQRNDVLFVVLFNHLKYLFFETTGANDNNLTHKTVAWGTFKFVEEFFKLFHRIKNFSVKPIISKNFCSPIILFWTIVRINPQN